MEEEAEALVPRLVAVYERLLGRRPRRGPHVCFYPYASTTSTIRLRDGQVRLRISDHLRDAPDEVLDGLMMLLVCRLKGVPERRADEAATRAYRAYLDDDKVAQRRAASRRERGSKHIDPIGRHRSLLQSFMRVVIDFDVRLPQAPTLSWTKTPSRRRFGHHDADVGAIVISQLLDDAHVPEFVLDYVVYHELLHIIHPPRMGSGGKRLVHPPEFRAAERRFPQQQEAEAWLETLASGRKRPRVVAA